MACRSTSSSKLTSSIIISRQTCVCFMLALILNDFCRSSLCYSGRDKPESWQRSKVNGRPRNQHHFSPAHNYRLASQQRQMSVNEYESLSKAEEKEIEDNKSAGQAKSVLPSKETDGNSQVVYVNLSRVVNDGTNKNESTRIIDSDGQLIKQDGQISCGETNRNGVASSTTDAILNRIVGGTKAEPGEFPYQVRLNIRSRRGSSLCGGVIIDKRHILTAAHCMTTW